MKPSTPKGTRDFSPTEMVRRNYIFDTIRTVFQRYGYLPIETPAMENTETLMGKYGEEGDRLIFKILNSGDFIKSAQIPTRDEKNNISDDEAIKAVAGLVVSEMKLGEINSKALSEIISEKALRYDLTVPFARYVVQHQNEIAFPFKRYQMQPVWRADRPQKGRYREFYQCDADVIGSNSLLNEVELVQLISEVFNALDIKIKIHFNNRKVLAGLAELVGEKDRLIDITIALDKVEKVGIELAMKELIDKGISGQAVKIIEKTHNQLQEKVQGPEMVNELKKIFTEIQIGIEGVKEVEYVFQTLGSLFNNGTEPNIIFDISLARGLNYYTGAIIEVKAMEGTLSSSICGGGRYDDLTGIFGLPNVSGVGISFGIDRIFDVLTELNKFDKIDYSKFTTRLMFAHFAEAEQAYCLPLLAMVRVAGINAELYPDAVKIKKQFDYANKKQIPFVVVVGGDEMQSGLLTFKNMQSGEQEKLTIGQVIERLK